MGANVYKIAREFYSDEWFTPADAASKAIEVLNPEPHSNIMCPYDSIQSEFVKQLTAMGHKVIFGIFDFIENDTYEFDYVITNPPFSIKNDVIERCLQSGKRSVLLLPIDALASQKRANIYRNFGNVPSAFIPDCRIDYLDRTGLPRASKSGKRSGSPFHTIYMILDSEQQG